MDLPDNWEDALKGKGGFGDIVAWILSFNRTFYILIVDSNNKIPKLTMLSRVSQFEKHSLLRFWHTINIKVCNFMMEKLRFWEYLV
jgi:hypothetical protein